MAQDREQPQDTEIRLEQAALRILERDGVLAGLNLREVADEAKVTRGLVYHYFGDRRSFLRSAIERAARRRRSTVLRRAKRKPDVRLRELFEQSLRDSTAVRLLTLLLLDGDKGVTSLPFADVSRAAYLRDIEDGLLAHDLDPDAIQAGMIAAVYGWTIYRHSFAASLGRTPEELDRDVRTMIYRMIAPALTAIPSALQ